MKLLVTIYLLLSLSFALLIFLCRIIRAVLIPVGIRIADILIDKLFIAVSPTLYRQKKVVYLRSTYQQSSSIKIYIKRLCKISNESTSEKMIQSKLPLIDILNIYPNASSLRINLPNVNISIQQQCTQENNRIAIKSVSRGCTRPTGHVYICVERADRVSCAFNRESCERLWTLMCYTYTVDIGCLLATPICENQSTL